MSKNHAAISLEHSTGAAAESVRAALECHAAERPDSVAMTMAGRTVSYRELNARANRLADQLCQQGVGPEVPVGLLCDRGFESIIGALAIIKADGVCVPFDSSLPSERLRTLFALAGSRLVVTTEAIQQTRPDLEGPVALVRLDCQCPVSPNLQSRLRPENTARINFTHGSNGRPRAVLITHAALENLVRWQQSTLPVEPGMRVLQFAPPGMDFAWQEIAGTLSAGGTLVIPTNDERNRASALLELLQRECIERAYLPAATIGHLASAFAESAITAGSLREIVAVCGPMRIHREVRHYFAAHPACRLHSHYGPTETLVVFSHSFTGPPEAWPSMAPLGRPIKGARVYLLDTEKQRVADGQGGELWIGGPTLARGYHRDPVSTRASFIEDPFACEGSQARLFRTGEFARQTLSGEFELMTPAAAAKQPARKRSSHSRAAPSHEASRKRVRRQTAAHAAA